MIAEYDDDESGLLGFDEFMKIIITKPHENETKDEIRKIFKQ